MKLIAKEVAMDLIRALREPLERLKVQDAELEDQARRAAVSVALNVAEGARRFGKDRAQYWRIAMGSANELDTALQIAVAWGYFTAEEVPAELADRMVRLLWGLVRAATASPSDAPGTPAPRPRRRR